MEEIELLLKDLNQELNLVIAIANASKAAVNRLLKEIENDMNSTLKDRETEKKSANFMEVKSIKRKELSVPGNKSVHITRISAVIKFV